MQLSDPITNLRGVGGATASKLAQLKISTLYDLLYFFPRKYDDYSHVTALKDIQPGAVTVKVKVEKVTSKQVRRGLHISDAVLSDGTSKIRAVWFNQPYRPASLQEDKEFFMSGVFDRQRDRFVLINPAVEKVADFNRSVARIVPTYRESAQLKSSLIRQLIAQAAPLIPEIPESLPTSVISREKLIPLSQALLQIHFPDSSQALAKAKARLAFDELFELLLASQLNKRENNNLPTWQIPYDQKIAEEFISQLQFSLTGAQKRASWDILQDIAAARPMNRLLQGDVGAGKTVVAAFAGFMAHRQQLQVALMAPTEVLAAQHAESLAKLLTPLGVNVGLLIGSVKPTAKKLLKQQLENGELHIIVGTHALIQDSVNYARLGLVVVDEQHRFGVKQRRALLTKGHKMPHMLAMTATPIPRSLTLTVYGELDVSILDERPPGRKPIKTEIVSPVSVAQMHKRVEAELQKGRQAYVICPLVSESSALDLKNVEMEYDKLRNSIFKKWRVGLLHGQMASEEKDRIMRDFKEHNLDLLVSTTVVEVGVDVPNATCMIIESADRFGLAQLHQLRGRIGRSEHQSYCFLVPSDTKQPSKRLREIAKSEDGFYLAEVDLELRGPGQLYGIRQHGALDLRLASISDTQLIAKVQKAVKAFLESDDDLVQYPKMSERIDTLRRLTRFN